MTTHSTDIHEGELPDKIRASSSFAVIGAGFGRTGTYSLKMALEMLSVGPCYHMVEVFARPEDNAIWHKAAFSGCEPDWAGLYFAGKTAGKVMPDGRPPFRSCTDWPACAYWRALADAFPQARVVLTVRDPINWYNSMHDTIYPIMRQEVPADDPVMTRHRSMSLKIILEDTFHGRFEDRAYAINIFNQHNDEVKRTIPSERLLVYQCAQGWDPLCQFLGLPTPTDASGKEVPFPRMNTREEFLGAHLVKKEIRT